MDWLERRSGFGQRETDARTPGDIDYGRIIHSASFRRLQGKTQIMNLGDSDFYRNRLTHSLEVAQIATGLVRQLGKNFTDHEAVGHLPCQSMTLAISSAHDLGHPPFGHGGEVALNYCMRDAGGFEGNGQTLRILSKLEAFSESDGADLTRRSLLGILKYPVSLKSLQNPKIIPKLSDVPTTIKTLQTKACRPPKGFMASEQDAVNWIFEGLSETDRTIFTTYIEEDGEHSKALHKSLDCSLMDIADDISYGVHDFEDAVAMQFISPKSLRELIKEELWSPYFDFRRSSSKPPPNDRHDDLIQRLFGESSERKKVISSLVGFFCDPICFQDIDGLSDPLLRWRVALPKPQADLLKALKGIVKTEVIKSPRVQHLEFKGQQMVVSVFEAFQSDPARLLPADAMEKFKAAGDDLRVICDHVAGMTDAHLMKTYERLFSPRMGSVFDKL